MTKNIKQSGFTIVELLIVIVVIAILAAITIVAYNGIQTRANVSATQGNVTILQKKLEAYNSVNSKYPQSGVATPTSANVTSDLNGTAESNLGNSIAIAAAPTATTGKFTFKVALCTAPAAATGYQITYWDYNTNSLPGTPQITGGTNSTPCTTYTAAS